MVVAHGLVSAVKTTEVKSFLGRWGLVHWDSNNCLCSALQTAVKIPGLESESDMHALGLVLSIYKARITIPSGNLVLVKHASTYLGMNYNQAFVVNNLKFQRETRSNKFVKSFL